MFTVAFLLSPLMKDSEYIASAATMLKKRLMILQRVCIGLLILTGLYLMTEDTHYVGWFSIDDRWSLLLLLKHIIISIMVLLLGVSSSVLRPLRQQNALAEDTVLNAHLSRWEMWIPRVQLFLATIIVLISANLVTL